MKRLILVPSELEFKQLTRELKAPIEQDGNGPYCLISGKNKWCYCGIGPTAAALSTFAVLGEDRADVVLLVGIAGAFRQSGFQPGDLVQADCEYFADLGYESSNAIYGLDDMKLPMMQWRGVDQGCRRPIEPYFEAVPSAPFVTVSSVTNSLSRADKLYRRYGAALENMEGAGAALAAAFHGVRFAELRAVSNFVGPRNPKRWRVEPALAALKAKLAELD